MALTLKQIKDVCLINNGAHTCRYLDEDLDDQSNIVHICKKKCPDRALVDSEIDLFMQDMKKTKQDPYKQGMALGDNCPGYLRLITKKQGYDVSP